jgi:hypothetical protein
MYFLTDNTVTRIEKAFLICAAQPTTAEFSTIYDGEKGEIGWGELSLSFNGFFINNDQVSLAAQRMLLAMRSPYNTTGSRLIVDSTNFAYEAIKQVNENMGAASGTESNDNPYISAVGNSWTDQNGVMNEAGKSSINDNKGKIGSIFDANSGVYIRSTGGNYSQQVAATTANGEHLVEDKSTN